MNILQFP